MTKMSIAKQEGQWKQQEIQFVNSLHNTKLQDQLIKTSLKRIILNSNRSQNKLHKKIRLEKPQSIFFEENSKEFIATQNFLNWDMRKGGKEVVKEGFQKAEIKQKGNIHFLEKLVSVIMLYRHSPTDRVLCRAPSAQELTVDVAKPCSAKI